jgi:spermidine/putrescine-binding protein
MLNSLARGCFLKKIFAILAFIFLLAGCTAKPKLILYTWSDMFPQEILDNFEKDTGIAVQYVSFDTNETMIERLKAVNGGRYDLVIADDYMVENVIFEGLAQKIDKSRLPNFQNINSLYQRQYYDPFDEYTIPYGAGVQTIVYDPEKVQIPIKGYFDLWHPMLARKVGIIDSFRVVNGIALKMMGQSYNTNDLELIRLAGEYLMSLAPNIRLIRDNQLEENILSGEIDVAVMYTSQVTMAKLKNPELEVVFPIEGIGFGIMSAFIPTKAVNIDAAYAFLDYIMDAKRGATCFEYLGYYSTFSASDPYIDIQYQEFLTIPQNFMNPELMEMIRNVSEEAEAMHNRVYTEFKATMNH